MKKDYWKDAPDIEVDTEKNVLRYYKEAAKLQISMPKWKDEDGNEKNGKTVTINLDALKETDGGIELLQNVIASIA